MNQLIKVEINENQEPIVSGRELHEFLEVKTAYKDWFPRMIDYGFEEGQDFCSNLSESTGGRPSTEHLIKIDMAKEICMIQRNEKGKQARQYFLAVEKELNSPEKVMARALKIADKTINQLKIEYELIKPKALFADAVAGSASSILIGELAKLIAQNGVEIGQNRLFQWLRDNRYLMSRGNSRNVPTQRSIELKIMELKERTIITPDGRSVLADTPVITGKGQVYFMNKFLIEGGKVNVN